jgi:putative OPT family oligopeptide transporter
METPPTRELTFDSIVLGLVLSVVMGAANVYLGLKAGMTVAASIPAAVISMGLLRGVFRRGTILENNQVQTAASAGESLAAGIIFTMPALVLIGVWHTFNYWVTTLVAFTGGLLGILFMIPMRRVFVTDNKELPYPEGVACAEVLRAGEHGATGAVKVFMGIGIGAVFKGVGQLLGLLKDTVEVAGRAGKSVFYAGADTSPALISVGYIVGLNIASLIFIGGAAGWLVAIPLLGGAGGGDGSALDTAVSLWKDQVRYIGVGAMAVGGVWSLVQVRRGLVSAIEHIANQIRARGSASDDPLDRDLDGRAIIALAALATIVIFFIYREVTGGATGLSVVTTVIMLVMAFFFTAVASYIVGLVGSSNSPVSGMTITAVLFTGGLLLLFGFKGEAGVVATLGVAGVVCCAACTSGDICNDLKTGVLVGASPRRQQIMEVLGVLVASFVMAPVMVALHRGTPGGIGGRSLPAPQASLFASLAEGFFGDGHLPWNMVLIGVAVGVVLVVADEVLKARDSAFRLHVMPVAVGIYLPFGTSVPILIGGLLNHLMARRAKSDEERSARTKRGVLLASGIIAGESLMGVGIAIVKAINPEMGALLHPYARRANRIAARRGRVGVGRAFSGRGRRLPPRAPVLPELGRRGAAAGAAGRGAARTPPRRAGLGRRSARCRGALAEGRPPGRFGRRHRDRPPRHRRGGALGRPDRDLAEAGRRGGRAGHRP